MRLNELLEIADAEERDNKIRRAFSSATALIEVTGCEFEVITILINLTLKRNLIKDLLSIEQAKKIVADVAHFNHCIEEVRWLHSHNLKYPDPRVSHQRLLLKSPQLVHGVISSSEEPNLLGWSHNSSKINCAKLFISWFILDGEVTCLALEVAKGSTKWLSKFAQFGLISELLEQLPSRLQSYLTEKTTPNEVSLHSKQVRIFDGESYHAITPVVSHSLMSKIQQLTSERQLASTMIEHAHPASIGDLAACQAGKVRALFYPPPVYTPKIQGISASKHQTLKQKKSPFDCNVLGNENFIHALKQLLPSIAVQTLRERRRARALALRTVRTFLAKWLGPMFEWRDDIEHRGVTSNLQDCLESDLLHMPKESLPELLVPLSNRLQEDLFNNRQAKPYAYHLELMQPLKSQLNWLLNQLSKGDDIEANSSTSLSYLHLSGLQVFDAQALSNPYLVGIPSMTALWGLAHHYERRLKQVLHRSVQIVGTAWYISQYHLTSKKQLPEQSIPRKLKEVSDIKRSGTVDNRFCDLRMELVFKLLSQDGTPPLLANELSLAQVAFPTRFAGGCILPPPLCEEQQWCQVYSSAYDLFDELKRLPKGGVWIYPVTGGVSSLNELPTLLAATPSYRPASVGFVALESLQNRTNSLEEWHCYAEPVIGIVNCRSPIDVRLEGVNAFFDNAFWHMDVNGAAMLLGKAPTLEPFYGVWSTT